MSRLGAALKAHNTGRQVYRPKPFKYTEIDSAIAEMPIDRSTEYRVSATFQTRLLSSDLEVRSGLHKQRVEQAKERIKHEIFGEFIEPLHEAVYRIDAGETEEGIELINKVLDALRNDEELKV